MSPNLAAASLPVIAAMIREVLADSTFRLGAQPERETVVVITVSGAGSRSRRGRRDTGARSSAPTKIDGAVHLAASRHRDHHDQQLAANI